DQGAEKIAHAGHELLLAAGFDIRLELPDSPVSLRDLALGAVDALGETVPQVGQIPVGGIFGRFRAPLLELVPTLAHPRIQLQLRVLPDLQPSFGDEVVLE